jgi:hypothetical protein
MNWKRTIAAALLATAALGTVAPAFADAVTTTTTTTTTTTPAPVVVPPPVVAAPAPVYVAPPATYVVAGWPGECLNLRSIPNGPIVGAMPPGTPLTLVGPIAGNWGFARTPAGYTGYAYLPYT